MRLLVLAILVLSSQICFADQEKPLVFEELGFQINVLQQKNKNVPFQPLLMKLPQRDGVSPNVNVQIQPWTATLQDYQALTESQAKQAGFKLINSGIKGGSYFLEYTGKIQGLSFYWYAKALKRENTIYLATATALVSQWPDYKEKLVNNVNSMKLLSGN